MRHALRVLGLGFAFSSVGFAAVPVPVSPGDRDRALPAAGPCPTFSWAAAGVERALELYVYRLDDQGAPGSEPVLRQRLPAGATAWTPSPDRCLSPGTYAWSVRGAGSEERATIHLFALQDDPRDREILRLRLRIDELEAARLPEAHRESTATATAPAGSAGHSQTPVFDSAFSPAACGAAVFSDVPAGSDFCPWIELAYADDLLEACATDPSLAFCPTNAVTRQQFAVGLEKVRHGAAGGALSGTYPDPDLAAAFKLPEDCATDDLVRWDGAAWACTECLEDASCGETTECQTASCQGFACDVDFTDPGTPLSTQTPGDCKVEQCDGAGASQIAIDDADVPADDGNACTGEVCNSGNPAHPNLDPGTVVGGACDAPSDTDACTEGLVTCNGSGTEFCDEPAENDVEVCDGADNDCNGSTDDNVPGTGQACSTGNFGVCAPGITVCNGAAGIGCSGVQPGSQQEICLNGLDDDCDNMVDEAGCTPP